MRFALFTAFVTIILSGCGGDTPPIPVDLPLIVSGVEWDTGYNPVSGKPEGFKVKVACERAANDSHPAGKYFHVVAKFRKEGTALAWMRNIEKKLLIILPYIPRTVQDFGIGVVFPYEWGRTVTTGGGTQRRQILVREPETIRVIDINIVGNKDPESGKVPAPYVKMSRNQFFRLQRLTR